MVCVWRLQREVEGGAGLRADERAARCARARLSHWTHAGRVLQGRRGAGRVALHRQHLQACEHDTSHPPPAHVHLYYSYPAQLFFLLVYFKLSFLGISFTLYIKTIPIRLALAP